MINWWKPPARFTCQPFPNSALISSPTIILAQSNTFVKGPRVVSERVTMGCKLPKALLHHKEYWKNTEQRTNLKSKGASIDCYVIKMNKAG